MRQGPHRRSCVASAQDQHAGAAPVSAGPVTVWLPSPINAARSAGGAQSSGLHSRTAPRADILGSQCANDVTLIPRQPPGDDQQAEIALRFVGQIRRRVDTRHNPDRGPAAQPQAAPLRSARGRGRIPGLTTASQSADPAPRRPARSRRLRCPLRGNRPEQKRDQLEMRRRHQVPWQPLMAPSAGRDRNACAAPAISPSCCWVSMNGLAFVALPR